MVTKIIDVHDELQKSIYEIESLRQQLSTMTRRYEWFRSKCFARGPECVQILEELGGPPYVGETIEQFVDRYVDAAKEGK